MPKPIGAGVRDREMLRKGYITPLQASQAAKVPLGTIYTWIRSGQLQVLRIGAGRGRIYIEITNLVPLAGPVLVLPNARGAQ